MMPLPTYGQIYPLALNNWPFPYKILLKGVDAQGWKIWASNVPWDSLQPAGTDYYISKTGSSGNTGLSPASPLDTLPNVFLKAGPWRIHVMEAGDWDVRKVNLPSINKTLDYSIVCDAGVAYFLGSELGITWVASPNYANVYFYANANVAQCLDRTNLDSNGYYTALTDVADPTVVSSTLNSEFVGSGLDGSGTYIRLFDDRNPNGSDSVLANLTTAEYRIRNDTVPITGYCKNIYWQGFQHVQHRVFSGSSRLTIVMDNCHSEYTLNLGSNLGGFEFLGTISYTRNCQSNKNLKDGFSYHANGGIGCWFYEEDCTGNDNGGDGLGNNNGSTSHDVSKGIRLRTTALRNEGPNIADVDVGTVTNNIRCIARDSTRSVAGNNYTAGQCTIYLDQCESSGSATDLITAGGGLINYISPTTFTLNGGAGTARKRANIESLYR